VNGTLAIPSARLQLDEVSAQATLPSTDTVVHGVVEPAPTRPLRVAAEITISLGEDVRYGGAGLDTALGGSLALSYQSGQRASATGNIDLEGQYQAYGQTLILERSRLFFGGPLDNPDLDVRAVRRIDPTIVGVQLTGPLRSPTTRVFSEPAMAEADALSFLILGRPLVDTDASETAALESAAVSMGLRQALPVVQRVGETLGFDEFTVQTSAANTGELMAGKQLTPRLYMRYTYGLFNRLGGLLMRLQLNDRFSLETRSGEYKSMDLIYSSEASE
jgi:translocation and assembly module TamB